MKEIINYSELGYDITFTYIYGKQALRMVKRYSYKAEKPLVCEQIVEHDTLIYNEEMFEKVLKFLYNNIQEQEDSGIYYESQHINFV